jgi:hypothetical protein
MNTTAPKKDVAEQHTAAELLGATMVAPRTTIFISKGTLEDDDFVL